MIAVVGFPRTSDRQLAADCGASSVVSKPYLLQELWAELQRVTAKGGTGTEQIAAA